jgi:hypothetical protein
MYTFHGMAFATQRELPWLVSVSVATACKRRLDACAEEERESHVTLPPSALSQHQASAKPQFTMGIAESHAKVHRSKSGGIA